MSETGQAVTAPQERRKGRRMLLLLVAFFALPLLLVVAMNQLQWRPGGASHGALVTPPRALQLSDRRTLQDKAFGVQQWHDKWHLVYIAADGCDPACQAQLHTLRQVHASLGKEIDRAQRVLLVPAAVRDESLAQLQQQYPDLVVMAGADLGGLVTQFDLPSQPAGRSGRVYLVDPLGNLMMSYPANYEPKKMRKDLLRLLTYSWVG